MLNDERWNWLSFRWFDPSVLSDYEWAYPLALYGIVLVPLLFVLRALLRMRRKQRLNIALHQNKLRWQPISLLRFIPPTLLALCLMLLFTAMARPQKVNEQVEQWTEGIDIMLVIDISESMKIEDFQPNRLEAAKETARDFIQGRFQDRIGLVIFSGEAYSLAPLTTDYQLLYNYIENLQFDMIETGGTAIGSALAVATNRMRESTANSKVLILMSDGENNAGNIDPLTAARLAHAYDIKMYSIAIGKEGRVPFGRDFFGRTNYIENHLDETVLREIARIGEGEFFRVSDNAALQEVFERIDQYEKAEIKESRYRDTADYYDVYLSWGMLFFLGWIFLKGTFLNNILTD